MALSIGSIAPDFSLPSTSQKVFTLSSDMKGKALILFFYPKDFTRGCTAEVCAFRDQFEEFRNLEIPVIGISRDSIVTHEKFKKTYRLPFELLSDETGKVTKDYDALIPLIKISGRITYLLDEEHKVAACYEGLFENKSHVQAMLRKLRA
jgi:peroxiredoxin Q/BCP